MKLRRALPPAPFPSLAPWIPAADVSPAARVVRRALAYCGVTEVGQNRGQQIDRWLRWANVPESLILSGRGNWCAAFIGGVLREEGLQVPVDYAACDAWLPFLVPGVVPRFGDIILYGPSPTDAQHIGLVVDAPKLSVEGNRSWAGASSNNGVAVDVGPILRRDILGYVPLDPFALGSA